MVAAIISNTAHSNTNQMISRASIARLVYIGNEQNKSFLLYQFYWKRLLSIKSYDYVDIFERCREEVLKKLRKKILKLDLIVSEKLKFEKLTNDDSGRKVIDTTSHNPLS